MQKIKFRLLNRRRQWLKITHCNNKEKLSNTGKLNLRVQKMSTKPIYKILSAVMMMPCIALTACSSQPQIVSVQHCPTVPPLPASLSSPMQINGLDRASQIVKSNYSTLQKSVTSAQ